MTIVPTKLGIVSAIVVVAAVGARFTLVSRPAATVTSHANSISTATAPTEKSEQSASAASPHVTVNGITVPVKPGTTTVPTPGGTTTVTVSGNPASGNATSTQSSSLDTVVQSTTTGGGTNVVNHSAFQHTTNGSSFTSSSSNVFVSGSGQVTVDTHN